MIQLLTGTCGAPVDTNPLTVDKKKWHVLNEDATYYFSVIDIKGKRIKIFSYGGQSSPYHLIDHFTYR